MRLVIWSLLLNVLVMVHPSQAGQSLEIQHEPNLVYASYGERDMLLDIHSPKPLGSNKRPAVVLLHGGGWWRGNKELFSEISNKLAEQGFVVANISYRLSVEAPFPAAIRDTKAAIRYVKLNADKYNVDIDNVFGLGFSAGGHLIAMAGLTANSDKFDNPDINAGVSTHLNAITIMGSGVDQVSRLANLTEGSRKSLGLFFGADFESNPARLASGSPITHVDEDSPAILMLDGALDKPGERYVDFVKKLDAKNVDHSFKVIPGAKHGEWRKSEFIDIYTQTYADYFKSKVK